MFLCEHSHPSKLENLVGKVLEASFGMNALPLQEPFCDLSGQVAGALSQYVVLLVELTPYPILRVTEGNDRIEPGKTLMLAAAGKSGVDTRAAGLVGQLAQVSGVVLERGSIDMMQLRGGRNGIGMVAGTAPDQVTEPLGRWKLAGEICDGKCLYGAMRPGRGLAH